MSIILRLIPIKFETLKPHILYSLQCTAPNPFSLNFYMERSPPPTHPSTISSGYKTVDIHILFQFLVLNSPPSLSTVDLVFVQYDWRTSPPLPLPPSRPIKEGFSADFSCTL